MKNYLLNYFVLLDVYCFHADGNTGRLETCYLGCGPLHTCIIVNSHC